MFNKRLIFDAVVGSQLYGMATPESDTDTRGVYLEDAKDIYGMTVPDKPYEDKSIDRTIYSLKQFAKLASGSNPNIVEMFYVPNSSIRFYNEIWNKIRENRMLFISKRVTDTFVGYVISQRKRMDTHHEWMMGGAPNKPNPEFYGMIYENGTPKWTDPIKHSEYENVLKDFQSYDTWIKNRNPKRHELEKNWGYDTKHGSHIYRLLRQVEELHLTGNITFPRPEADFLKQIRGGVMRYDELIGWMEDMIVYIQNDAHKKSVLPERANITEIDNLLIDIYKREL